MQDETEEVVVTGILHSIETSISTKRESTSIVEVVSAEDIGKLPDTSIADSIARLPGLAAGPMMRQWIGFGGSLWSPSPQVQSLCWG